MKSGQAFANFFEGPINFPPTFKYDVMRTLKRDKSGLSKEHSKGHGNRRWRHHSFRNLSEVEEKSRDTILPSADSGSVDGRESPEKERLTTDNEDTASVISTAISGTSFPSRMAMNIDSTEPDDYFAQPRSVRSTNARSDQLNSPFMEKVVIVKAALKAKTKWLSLLSSPKVSSPSAVSLPKRLLSRSKRNSPASLKRNSAAPSLSLASEAPEDKEESPDVAATRRLLPPSSPFIFGRARAVSASELRHTLSKQRAKSNQTVNIASIPRDNGQPVKRDVYEDRGVYDSSSKQRVPSW